MSGGDILTAEPVTTAQPGSSPDGARRRPWWVWVVPFVLVLAVLAVRSRFLFTARLYEQGDAAANSILIEQAKHFTLLVGNYSRERFNHPGPAYMYVQAAGEFLFLNLLHLVPTAWNAHVLAVFALNGGWVAAMTAIIYGWTRSAAVPLAALAAFLACVVAEPSMLSYDWMPWMYVPTYVVFVIAAGSVAASAAGARRDLWILTLSGWFLIHGHAAFLFLVPVVVCAALAIVVWRHGPRACLRAFARPRTWIPVTAISAVFLLPIVVDLALHWPGNFGKYFSYSSSSQAGGHTAAQIARYILWFWSQHGPLWAVALVPAGAYAVAIAVTAWLARPSLRPFLFSLLAVNVASMLAFGLYVAVGIDNLSQYYIGYFSWSAPIVTALVIAIGLADALPARVGALPARPGTRAARPGVRSAQPGVRPVRLGALSALAGAPRLGKPRLGKPRLGALRFDALVGAAAVIAATIAFAAAPATAANTGDTDAALPAAVAAASATAHGKPIVIYVTDHNAWPDVTGFLVQSERAGVRACVANPWWTFMMTSQFICTPGELKTGLPFRLYQPPVPPHNTVIARVKNSVITVAAA